MVTPAENLSPNTPESVLREGVTALLTGIFNGTLAPGDIFTEDYRQTTDGHVLDLAGVMAHLQHVSRQVRAIRFEVLDACFSGTLLADRHIARIVTSEGRMARIEVLMFTRMNGCRIQSIDEHTRSLDNRPEDCQLARST